MANPGPWDHAHGIKAHIMIELNEGIDLDDAWKKITAAKPAHGKDPKKRFHLINLHVTLGEVDMMADVHCAWTTPRGQETRVIAEWVNSTRQLKSGGALIVASTSTNVCANWP